MRRLYIAVYSRNWTSLVQGTSLGEEQNVQIEITKDMRGKCLRKSQRNHGRVLFIELEATYAD